MRPLEHYSDAEFGDLVKRCRKTLKSHAREARRPGDAGQDALAALQAVLGLLRTIHGRAPTKLRAEVDALLAEFGAGA